MTDKFPFLKLPEIVMDNVLHYCDYMEIASLRKTCRSLREFVDTAKPDGRVDKLMIDCDAYEGKFLLQLGEKTVEISYTKTMDGCSIFDTGNWMWSILLKGEDYMELLKSDFSVLLRHQKSLLKVMEIRGKSADIEQVLNILKAHSKNPRARKFPLRTSKLSLIELSVSQILLALSSVDAQSLRSLSIRGCKQNMLLNEITETEQWRHLDTCIFTGLSRDSNSISGFRISDVCRISHLNSFRGHVTMVSAADLYYLKTTFLKSTNFSSCRIRSDSIASVSDIATTFGVQPFVRNGIFSSHDEWFFRKPNDKFGVLYLSLKQFKHVKFGHKNNVKVPTGAVIID
ncbi:hypothetical protein GCK72_021400 [Caenorhabditis remanei]|uniref:F-box domain-containing protein n=1 Tax=Caenorhabditis remanei TaxID=31234 RepID=A0A6A5GJV4_CAERE|nr:hypothetical protein GCK72_021400 [Caenorhabditis remanei]KAF1754835.1 hypothetical protein GCK72_021400 [Caenorhabditis remanei]